MVGNNLAVVIIGIKYQVENFKGRIYKLRIYREVYINKFNIVKKKKICNIHLIAYNYLVFQI